MNPEGKREQLKGLEKKVETHTDILWLHHKRRSDLPPPSIPPDPWKAGKAKQKDPRAAGLQNRPGVPVASSGSADPGNAAAPTSTSAASSPRPAHNRTRGDAREEAAAQQSCPGTLPVPERTEVSARGGDIQRGWGRKQTCMCFPSGPT